MSESEKIAATNTNNNYLLSIALPVGTILDFAGDKIPRGALVCDGSAVSRDIYSKLFEAIGTIYGEGDGINTFNLPDFRGKVAVGVDENDKDFSELAKSGGEKSHQLTVEEMPEHQHQQIFANSAKAILPKIGSARSPLSDDMSDLGEGSAIKATGGDQPHNNLQPYGTTYKIIVAFGGMLSVYDIAVANGFVGTEAEWLNSLKGKSAYEIAVANGFSGTEKEWLDSLKPDDYVLSENDKNEIADMVAQNPIITGLCKLTDRTTGKVYELFADNGKLYMEETAEEENNEATV